MDTRKSCSDSQTNPVTCTVLYTKFNALCLARVVGSQRCRHMISSDKQVYMLVTGGDEDMWMVMVFWYLHCVSNEYTLQSCKALNVVAVSFWYWNDRSCSCQAQAQSPSWEVMCWNHSLLGIPLWLNLMAWFFRNGHISLGCSSCVNILAQTNKWTTLRWSCQACIIASDPKKKKEFHRNEYVQTSNRMKLSACFTQLMQASMLTFLKFYHWLFLLVTKFGKGKWCPLLVFMVFSILYGLKQR